MVKLTWIALSLVAVALGREPLEVMVPMRDGVRLATTIHVPDGEGRWPSVLRRTPYGKDNNAGDVPAFLKKGVARINQDCRGKGKSEGTFKPFDADLTDGYDTIEWIAGQPWSNGKTGVMGSSAPGVMAYLTAMSAPPHLTAAWVDAAHARYYHGGAFPGGLSLTALNEDWPKSNGLPGPGPMRPILRLFDDWYRRFDMQPSFGKVNIPILHSDGWFDPFAPSVIEAYEGLQAGGGPLARGKQKLMLSARGHGPVLDGDLKYPNATNAASWTQVRWFEHWLKGVDTGFMKEPAVRYYVLGDPLDSTALGNEWRTAASWPPASERTPYYLQTGGKLAPQHPDDKDASDSFLYDPRNPVPTAGGANLGRPQGPLDQRKVSRRSDVLRYESEPLSTPVEIAGKVTADLWVSTDAEDTDFVAKLIDVFPSGYEALMLDRGLRLRFRDGFEAMARVEKSRPYRIQLDLGSIALVFHKGHRIAIHISSSNAPRFGPHSNTWEPVVSFDQAVKAHNTVFRDSSRASSIQLPLIR